MKKNSRFLSLLLAFTMVFSSFSLVFADEEQAAKDLASNWAVGYLMEAQIQELADGAYFAKFKEGVTREELANFAVTLYEKFSEEVTPISPNPFKDTDNQGVLKALTLGLFTAEGEEFFPEEKVKREDVATVIYNVIHKCEPNILGSSEDKVKAIVSNGILKGKSANDLGLDDICTREEVLSLFARTYDFIVHKTDRAAKGFMWEVSNGKNSVYVLGSIHTGDSSIYPFSEGILDAFDNSNVLAVEANIVADKEGTQYMMDKASYSGDDTLEKNISEETYKLFVETIKSAGLNPEDYVKFKPWFAALLVQNLATLESSLDPTLGIDYNLIIKAMFGGKDIMEIEGIKFQTDLFDSMPKEIQENFLRSSIDEKDTKDTNTSGELVKYMLELWKKGDMVEFEKIMSQASLEMDGEFGNIFLNERNKNMVDKVEEFLNSEDGKSYFVVVGAGHLTGDTGIINALKDKGYTVKQIIK